MFSSLYKVMSTSSQQASMVYRPRSISHSKSDRLVYPVALLMSQVLQELLYLVTLFGTKRAEPSGVIDEHHL